MHMTTSYTSLPLLGLANIKDNHSNFINFSQDFAKLLGWKSDDQWFGKTDHDIPCEVAKFADEFVKMDRMVIETGKKMVALDIQNYCTGWNALLVEKNPLKDKSDKIVGLYSTCINVSDINPFRYYFRLHQFDNKLHNIITKPASYILTNSHSPLPLTEKQENCLFLLVRGKTIKQIAKLLNISPRTVECHLDLMKIKLNCSSKAEVIEKAIDRGFLYYIPFSLKDSHFERIVKSL
jgi:DNA-binding CsgD family transcriptional regulator